MSMKLQLTILAESAPPDTAECRPSLKEKIEYAIDCIECGHRKEEAIHFLRVAHNKLVQLPRTKVEHQVLIDMIKPVLGEYGSYLLSQEDREDDTTNG